MLTLLCAGGCVKAYNYGAGEPRYAGSFADARSSTAPERLRIVTFNIAFARQIDSAIAVLTEPELRDADILLLQEMDAPGTERIARALRMSYVYYPATRHPQSGRDFGNAVLSRWPIVADSKILLPHIAVIGDTRRTATAATIRVGDLPVRVYSAHLGTVVNITPAQRREQLQAIIDDARAFDRVIIGGDMNDPVVGEMQSPTATRGPHAKGRGPRRWRASITCSSGAWDRRASMAAARYGTTATRATITRSGVSQSSDRTEAQAGGMVSASHQSDCRV